MGILIFCVFFVYAIALSSILEWFVHKHFMHSTRFMRTPHQRHAITHHAERRAPGRFFAPQGELMEYHVFETSFMPLLWFAFTPFFGMIYYLFGPWASSGVAAAIACYIATYEIFHWSIHCPDKFLFRTSRWFLFLTEHHRRHHHRSNVNYNVVLPLADWLFNTLSHRELPPEPQ